LPESIEVGVAPSTNVDDPSLAIAKPYKSTGRKEGHLTSLVFLSKVVAEPTDPDLILVQASSGPITWSKGLQHEEGRKSIKPKPKRRMKSIKESSQKLEVSSDKHIGSK
jgi:hypothetical protein